MHVVPPPLQHCSSVESECTALGPFHRIFFNIAIVVHFHHSSCFWSKLSIFTLGLPFSNERSILIVFVDECFPNFISHSIIESRTRPRVSFWDGCCCSWLRCCSRSGSRWKGSVFWRDAKGLFLATNATSAHAVGVSCAWISHLVDHPPTIIT
ncbi:unnamed protein product [Haemonchus placei]|uniref:Uncharacterized protein n=1 Tax=Haemonchus placei TaxID=6290 RepID=A0A3P7WXL3_HAEPC|nr:unnamed protein product [Haemonchus placei]